LIDEAMSGASSVAPLILIGLCGRLGTGKDTVADILESRHEFQRASFAGVLKDVVAAAFAWDRDLLEGRTAESRAWREQVDEYWSSSLGMPGLTPRLALQLWGTDVVRKGFHGSFWLKALERCVQSGKYGRRVVITDCRFPNECDMVRALGGTVVCVERGPHPEWERSFRAQGTRPAGVHESEWSWMGQEDDVVDNDGALDDLADAVDDLVADL
jgi:hypothetical protein